MRFYFRTGRGSGISVGPIGLLILWPLYLCWIGAVGLTWFFVLLVRLVVFLAPLVWSFAVLAWSLVVLGLAHLRARSSGPATD